MGTVHSHEPPEVPVAQDQEVFEVLAADIRLAATGTLTRGERSMGQITYSPHRCRWAGQTSGLTRCAGGSPRNTDSRLSLTASLVRR
jgi:hypothetical protein